MFICFSKFALTNTSTTLPILCVRQSLFRLNCLRVNLIPSIDPPRREATRCLVRVGNISHWNARNIWETTQVSKFRRPRYFVSQRPWHSRVEETGNYGTVRASTTSPTASTFACTFDVHFVPADTPNFPLIPHEVKAGCVRFECACWLMAVCLIPRGRATWPLAAFPSIKVSALEAAIFLAYGHPLLGRFIRFLCIRSLRFIVITVVLFPRNNFCSSRNQLCSFFLRSSS